MVDAETTHIAGNRRETVDQNKSVTIGLARTHSVGAVDTLKSAGHASKQSARQR